jgi:transposase
MKLKKKATVARRIRRMHSPEFKARIALQGLRESNTMTELCQEHDLHANQIIDWKRQLLEWASSVYSLPAPTPAEDVAPMQKMAALHLAHPFMGSDR